MILTDEEIKALGEGNQGTWQDDLQFAKAIESAVLAKLNSAEPVGYLMPHYQEMSPIFMWRPLPKGYSARMGKPLYTTPQPDRTAELEAALREARANLYDMCDAAIVYRIDKVLK